MDIWAWIILIIALFILFDDDTAFFVLIVVFVFSFMFDEDEVTPTPELAQNVLEIVKWDCPVDESCVIGEGNEVFLKVKLRPGAKQPKVGGFIQIAEPGEELAEEDES